MRSLLFIRYSALTLALMSSAALADTRIEINAGRSFTDSYGTNTAWVESIWNEHPFGGGRFTWAPIASLGFIEGRHLSRYDGRMSDDVWLGAGGLRLRYGNSDDWYHHLFWSSQIAFQGGRTMALSSGGEFVNSIGWSGTYWTFQIRHASNGGFKGENRGETMALVGITYDP